MLVVPLLPPAQELIVPVSITQPQTGQLNFTYTPTAGGTSQIMVFASPIVSTGVTALPRLSRFLGSVRSNTASPFDITAMYIAAYGNIPSSGRVFVKWHQTDRFTGLAYGSDFASTDLA